MKCNPLRWLWGLLPLAVWTWITVLGEHERIEADLKQRTEEALANAGLGWAKTTFQGRDGILSGRALEDNEPQSALQTATNVYGVRIVDPQTDLIRKVDNYLWSATAKEGSAITLSGYVPNEKTRKSIIGVVKANFPKSQIHDRMELARGVPAGDSWLSGVSFGLKQLAALKHGHVDLAGLDVTIAGEATDVPSYKSIKSALRSGLPSGTKLVSDKVTPPVVDPYSWTAHSTGSQVVLNGYAPSDKVREEIVSHAKAAFPKASVSDRMELAEGALAGHGKAAMTIIDQLAALRTGDGQIRASQITVTGMADDEYTAGKVRQALKAKIPGAYKTSDTINFPKPPPPAAAPVEDDTSAREAEARRKAEQEAAEAKRKAEHEAAEAKRKAAELDAAEAKRRAEQEAAEARRKAEHAAAEAKRKAEEEATEAKRKADQAAAEAKRKAEQDAVEAKRNAELAVKKAEADKCQTAMRNVASAGIIRFERASAALDRASHQTLDKVAKAANACPTLKLEVEGHTDAEGTPERNKGLSERRAKSVLDYLSQAGVDVGRMEAVGYGETHPVAPNDTAENRAKNRRIEFSVKAE